MNEYFKAKLDITVTIDGQDETTTIKKGDIYCGYRRLASIGADTRVASPTPQNGTMTD